MLITDKELLKSYTASKNLWVGIPSIEITKKGRTFLTFYSGGKTEEIGNYVLLIKSDDGVNFSDPVVVCFEEGYRCYDPCIWIDPLGRLWLTWSRCPEDGVFGAICDDPDAEEIVFGEEFFIGHNVMMNKPIVLSTREWAFPVAVWNYGIEWIKASDITPKGSFMYITDDCGKTFKRLGYADVKNRACDEHMFLEMNDGVIRVFVRTAYGIGAADSYDGGLHFGKDFDTGYKGPCSRFHIRRMPSGRVLLINHYNYSGRNNLTAMLSEDDGQTFPYRLLLDERNNVSYPDAAIDKDGNIHITYDRERGSACSCFDDIMSNAREILTACICEEDIISGCLVDKNSYLKRVAYKLTNYDGELQNPFNEKNRFTDNSYALYLSGDGRNAEEIISKIFDEYNINCSNIHNIQAESFDKLIEAYKSSNDLTVLNEIIHLVRSVHGKEIYSEKNIVDEICRYIIDNPECDCSTQNIAKIFHYSSHYIRHIFKKQTGISVKEFQTAQIIKTAKLLLRMCDDKITDIAATCGFESPSYFTEVFTKEVGMSPKDYRKK
ncbi:MAG: exo-alpha-sialidase [Clostridia bacterium]|nr:exo-alpha-sialidase [Clostridia bacterium]